MSIVGEARESTVQTEWWPKGVLTVLLLSGLVFACALQLLAGAACDSSLAGQGSTDRNFRYQVVPGWPAFPSNLPLAAVSAVAVAKDGRVFVLRRGKHPVLVFDASGKFLNSWGDGVVSELGHGLRIDPTGFVWITDLKHQQVYKFTADGELKLTLGKKDTAGERVDQFNQPTDVAVTRSGDIFVSDGYGNARILKFDATGKLLRIWGHAGAAPGEFHTPHAICLDSKERLIVSDRENFRFQIFDSEGKFLDEWQNLPPMDGLYCAPDDTLFTSSGRGNEIFRLTEDGRVLETFGGPHSTEEEIMGNVSVPFGRFNEVHALALDPQGNVYVAEVRARRVEKVARTTKVNCKPAKGG